MTPPHGFSPAPSTSQRRPILIASNRGPVSLVRKKDGSVEARRGAGGLVAAMSGALQNSGGWWIAAAMTEEDRRRAEVRGGDALEESGLHLRYLALDRDDFDRYYNEVSNRILWFDHHYLWDVPRVPAFDAGTAHAWEAYRRVNRAFAGALEQEAEAAEGEPTFLVQDYHLTLVPAMLRASRPGARIVWFSHIPFAGPSYFRILPSDMRRDLLSGVLGSDLIGFQSSTWADNFLLCCGALTSARVDLEARTVLWDGREVAVGVYPVSIEPGELMTLARSPEAARQREVLEARVGDRKLILRVDRAELSKNIIRGLIAFEQILEGGPEWGERVMMLALLNPSRQAVPEYRSYVEECLAVADRINSRFGEGERPVVEVNLEDNYPGVLAAFSLYDVLLVNPVFDGMNLVAKEGPLLNEKGGVLVLSENAGACAELGEHALVVNPFDVSATAEALRQALDMEDKERHRRVEGLRRAILAHPLGDWVSSQLRDLDQVRTQESAAPVSPGPTRTAGSPGRGDHRP